MSYQAIRGALALTDVSAGERLVALALASWANTEHLSYPGTRLAAARAGMSKRQFEDARDTLAQRGLIAVESHGGGRGNKATVRLLFAETGPWCDYELNAPLMDAVLSHSRLKGSARVLLAVLAACANADGVVDGLTTDELCAAAGMPDRTYRRARTVLLSSGEASVANAGGGRARLNAWLVHDPRAEGAPPLRAAAERPVVPSGARPLMTSARPLPEPEMAAVKGADLTGVSPVKGAELTGVSIAKGAELTGVTAIKGAELTRVSRKTPAETPAQTPAPNARTGRESQNPLNSPPNPPGGGNRQIQFVEESLTDKGRRRPRTVIVDLDDLPFSLPTSEQQATWQWVRSEFIRIVGQDEFELHLRSLTLAGVQPDGELLIACTPALLTYLSKRYRRLFERAANAGTRIRMVSKRELLIHDALARATPLTTDHVTQQRHQEAV